MNLPNVPLVVLDFGRCAIVSSGDSARSLRHLVQNSLLEFFLALDDIFQLLHLVFEGLNLVLFQLWFFILCVFITKALGSFKASNSIV